MERTDQRRGVRRRLGLSLAAAAALHALVVFLLWRTPPAPPPAHEPPLVVDLVEVTRPPPQQPRPPPAVKPPPTRVAPIARAARRSVPAENAPLETPSLRPGLETSPQAGGTGAGAGGIAKHEQLEQEPVRLFDPGAIAESHRLWQAKEGEGNGGGLGGLAWGGVGSNAGTGRGEGTGDGEGPEAEHKRVSERIARDLEDAQAASRVGAGLYDPYFAGLSRGVKDGWKPAPSMVGASDDTGFAGRLGNTLKTWQSIGSTWGRTGSPYAAGEAPEVDTRQPELRAAGGTSGFDASDFMARWNRGEFGEADAVVVLKLTQDRTGAPLRVDVLQASGFASLDESAVEAVRAVALDREPPPATGLGLGDDTIRTVWKFEAKVVAKTCGAVLDATGQGLMNAALGGNPLSQVLGAQCGGTFDPALGVAEVDTPGETIVVTKVALMALYGGGLKPVEP